MRKRVIYPYIVKIHPGASGETGYWAEVPALPGCFTQGETYEEVVLNIKEAIQAYLQSLAKTSKAIPERGSSKRRSFATIVEVPLIART